MFRRLERNIVSRCYKYNLYVTSKLHTTTQCLVENDQQSFESKQASRINEIFGKYTIQDEQKILSIVNNYNLNELLSYDISKSRANKLTNWRVRNGLMKNINDIFSIEGFGVKAVDKFYQSLLKENKTSNENLVKPRTTAFIIPSLDPELRENMKSCVSIRIGVNSITWSRLDIPQLDTNIPCLLTHWQHHDISEKKLHLRELIQRCLYVNHLIPMGDCYIFENPKMIQASNNPGNVEQQNINIQKAQVTAVIGYALASRYGQLNEKVDTEADKRSLYQPSVFYLKRFLAARLFNHLVGSERVSSEQTILNMMRTYYNTQEEETTVENFNNIAENDLNLSGRVQFPSDLRQLFSKSPRYHRELLGQALLLNLAFVNLVLLQDSESINMVSKGNKLRTA